MAPRIENLDEWSAHLLDRLQRQVVVSADPALTALRDELLAYPGVVDRPPSADDPASMLFVPLRLRGLGDGSDPLAFFSTVATFGTALDITLAELSIESFFPADDRTAEVLRRPR